MIFIDTWGFIALTNKKEPKHNQVMQFLTKTWESKAVIYTSDYVLDETITLLSRKLDFNKVNQFINSLNQAINNGFINVLWILKQDFNLAIKKRLHYEDKLDISFTDLTTAVLMEKQNITKIATEDKHFTFLNKNFEVLFL